MTRRITSRVLLGGSAARGAARNGSRLDITFCAPPFLWRCGQRPLAARRLLTTSTPRPDPTDLQRFYAENDPEKENLCLYGLEDGTWKVSLPEEEVPPELPEPSLGINFARDGMQVGRRPGRDVWRRGGARSCVACVPATVLGEGATWDRVVPRSRAVRGAQQRSRFGLVYNAPPQREKAACNRRACVHSLR